jgi:hypothetical protein
VSDVAPKLVLLGCCRNSDGTSTFVFCFGQNVVIERPCSQILLADVKEGGGWLVQQYVSEISPSEDVLVSSDDWEDTSDQTEAEEEEADEAIEELYGPFRYDVM